MAIHDLSPIFHNLRGDKPIEGYDTQWHALLNQFCQENPQLLQSIFTQIDAFQETAPLLIALGLTQNRDLPTPPYTADEIYDETNAEARAWADQMQTRQDEVIPEYMRLLAQAARAMLDLGMKIYVDEKELQRY